MNTAKDKALADFLKGFVTDHKKQLLEEVLNKRTRHITVALEDIFQTQNASAVVRSCDCFGIQDIHVIENQNEYLVNPLVTQGSSKWVDIFQYNETSDNTSDCIEHLRNKGYSIVGTVPSSSATSIYEYQPVDKTAFLFGTELTGLSEEAIKQCDEMVNIPMLGFTESFNLSVSAALLMQVMRRKLDELQVNYLLSEEEKILVRINWYKKIITNSESYVNHFESTWNEKNS